MAPRHLSPRDHLRSPSQPSARPVIAIVNAVVLFSLSASLFRPRQTSTDTTIATRHRGDSPPTTPSLSATDAAIHFYRHLRIHRPNSPDLHHRERMIRCLHFFSRPFAQNHHLPARIFFPYLCRLWTHIENRPPLLLVDDLTTVETTTDSLFFPLLISISLSHSHALPNSISFSVNNNSFATTAVRHLMQPSASSGRRHLLLFLSL